MIKIIFNLIIFTFVVAFLIGYFEIPKKEPEAVIKLRELTNPDNCRKTYFYEAPWGYCVDYVVR